MPGPPRRPTLVVELRSTSQTFRLGLTLPAKLFDMAPTGPLTVALILDTGVADPEDNPRLVDPRSRVAYGGTCLMDSATAVSKHVHGGRGSAARRAIASLPLWLQVAAAGYAVVALFALAYLVVSVAWDGLSSSATAVVAGLVAAPFALGLLWPRLTGFAAFGIEVTLAHVTVQPDTKLAAAITSPALGSREPDLVKQMEAITETEVELLEVDLGDGSYWWSTRLYLLAALAQDLSDVRGFIFLTGGLDCRFLGIASPATVRRALAAEAPELETTYLKAAQPAPVEDARSRVSQIVYTWVGHRFGPEEVSEDDFASLVSPDSLHAAIEAIGRRLNTDSIDWPGYAKPPIVRALVRDFDGEYVALIRAGSFDRVVNRRALAVEIAAGAA